MASNNNFYIEYTKDYNSLTTKVRQITSKTLKNVLYFDKGFWDINTFPHEKINVIKKLPATFFRTLQMSFYTKDQGQNFCINNIEFGKIKTEIGQTIISAAIIDDVIGIIVLTMVIGVSSGKGGYFGIILKTIAFFICSIIIGYLVYKFFRWYDKRHPHSRRIPIYALGCALIFAYCAEEFFGIADITGAYIAGIVLCSLSDASYMESKIDINSYMFFSPIFFASIGLKTNLAGFDMSLLWFAFFFVVIGCCSKIIGCGAISKAMGFSWKESYQIGLGMMVRGEVALIVATKGLSVGLIDSKYFTSVILLIIVSSMLVPIMLKKAFNNKKELQTNS